MTEENKFFARSIERDMNYQVILPEGYGQKKRYPVLYLLHGINQDYLSWTRFSFIELFAAHYPYIIAIPNIDDNWYLTIQWGCRHLAEYMREFIHHVDQNYRTLSYQMRRGCCGVSMGGYGSYYIAVQYPSLFRTVSALSGIFNFKNHTGFGSNSEICIKKESEKEYNLVDLMSKIKHLDLSLLFDSGIEDEMSYKDSLDLHEVLDKNNIPHTFRVHRGKHDWHYWNEHLEEHLSFHKKQFERKSCFS